MKIFRPIITTIILFEFIYQPLYATMSHLTNKVAPVEAQAFLNHLGGWYISRGECNGATE